ncbi:AAA family ATPase [Candidatus Woesearchaeota archaeon]|nr:AAA family ATPase [Candidatus Woesearchaeota archaeon]
MVVEKSESTSKATTSKEMTFASVLKNPIYQRRDVLYALTPPTGFLHRTEQKNELVMELAPILMGNAVSSVFVYGNPGTGKTGLILELIKELEEEAKKNDINLKTAYVNCSENRTETVILLEVLNQLAQDKEYPKMGWNRAKAIDEFNKVLDELQCHVLVVLDEVDYVLKEAGDDILYRLSRINGDIKSQVSSIMISNDVRVSDYIKPRTQSTIGRVKVIFAPYNAEELMDILKERARFAFKEGVVSEPVLKKIAEIEATRDGDARKALELLDNCAKGAIAKKRTKITLDLVDEADANLERDQMLNVIASLTQHQKLAYLAILNNQKKIMGGMDVYKLYLETCESYNIEPLTERRVRSFVVNLNETGLIQSEVGWLSDLKKKTRKIEVTLDTALKNKAIKLIRDSI